jgi:hypothetical protein
MKASSIGDLHARTGVWVRKTIALRPTTVTEQGA